MPLADMDKGCECSPARDVELLDMLFRILSASERRYTIRLLQAANGPMATADLAHEIGKQETRPSKEEDSFDSAADVETTLHHIHLPKLQSANVVEVDTDRKTVSPGECFETFARVLQSMDDAFPTD